MDKKSTAFSMSLESDDMDTKHETPAHIKREEEEVGVKVEESKAVDDTGGDGVVVGEKKAVSTMAPAERAYMQDLVAHVEYPAKLLGELIQLARKKKLKGLVWWLEKLRKYWDAKENLTSRAEHKSQTTEFNSAIKFGDEKEQKGQPTALRKKSDYQALAKRVYTSEMWQPPGPSDSRPADIPSLGDLVFALWTDQAYEPVAQFIVNHLTPSFASSGDNPTVDGMVPCLRAFLELSALPSFDESLRDSDSDVKMKTERAEASPAVRLRAEQTMACLMLLSDDVFHPWVRIVLCSSYDLDLVGAHTFQCWQQILHACPRLFRFLLMYLNTGRTTPPRSASQKPKSGEKKHKSPASGKKPKKQEQQQQEEEKDKEAPAVGSEQEVRERLPYVLSAFRSLTRCNPNLAACVLDWVCYNIDPRIYNPLLPASSASVSSSNRRHPMVVFGLVLVEKALQTMLMYWVDRPGPRANDAVRRFNMNYQVNKKNLHLNMTHVLLKHHPMLVRCLVWYLMTVSRETKATSLHTAYTSSMMMMTGQPAAMVQFDGHPFCEALIDALHKLEMHANFRAAAQEKWSVKDDDPSKFLAILESDEKNRTPAILMALRFAMYHSASRGRQSAGWQTLAMHVALALQDGPLAVWLWMTTFMPNLMYPNAAGEALHSGLDTSAASSTKRCGLCQQAEHVAAECLHSAGLFSGQLVDTRELEHPSLLYRRPESVAEYKWFIQSPTMRRHLNEAFAWLKQISTPACVLSYEDVKDAPYGRVHHLEGKSDEKKLHARMMHTMHKMLVRVKPWAECVLPTNETIEQFQAMLYGTATASSTSVSSTAVVPAAAAASSAAASPSASTALISLSTNSSTAARDLILPTSNRKRTRPSKLDAVAVLNYCERLTSVCFVLPCEYVQALSMARETDPASAAFQRLQTRLDKWVAHLFDYFANNRAHVFGQLFGDLSVARVEFLMAAVQFVVTRSVARENASRASVRAALMERAKQHMASAAAAAPTTVFSVDLAAELPDTWLRWAFEPRAEMLNDRDAKEEARIGPVAEQYTLDKESWTIWRHFIAAHATLADVHLLLQQCVHTQDRQSLFWILQFVLPEAVRKFDAETLTISHNEMQQQRKPRVLRKWDFAASRIRELWYPFLGAVDENTDTETLRQDRQTYACFSLIKDLPKLMASSPLFYDWVTAQTQSEAKKDASPLKFVTYFCRDNNTIQPLSPGDEAFHFYTYFAPHQYDIVPERGVKHEKLKSQSKKKKSKKNKPSGKDEMDESKDDDEDEAAAVSTIAVKTDHLMTFVGMSAKMLKKAANNLEQYIATLPAEEAAALRANTAPAIATGLKQTWQAITDAVGQARLNKFNEQVRETCLELTVCMSDLQPQLMRWHSIPHTAKPDDADFKRGVSSKAEKNELADDWRFWTEWTYVVCRHFYRLLQTQHPVILRAFGLESVNSNAGNMLYYLEDRKRQRNLTLPQLQRFTLHQALIPLVPRLPGPVVGDPDQFKHDCNMTLISTADHNAPKTERGRKKLPKDLLLDQFRNFNNTFTRTYLYEMLMFSIETCNVRLFDALARFREPKLLDFKSKSTKTLQLATDLARSLWRSRFQFPTTIHVFPKVQEEDEIVQVQTQLFNKYTKAFQNPKKSCSFVVALFCQLLRAISDWPERAPSVVSRATAETSSLSSAMDVDTPAAAVAAATDVKVKVEPGSFAASLPSTTGSWGWSNITQFFKQDIVTYLLNNIKPEMEPRLVRMAQEMIYFWSRWQLLRGVEGIAHIADDVVSPLLFPESPILFPEGNDGKTTIAQTMLKMAFQQYATPALFDMLRPASSNDVARVPRGAAALENLLVHFLTNERASKTFAEYYKKTWSLRVPTLMKSQCFERFKREHGQSRVPQTPDAEQTVPLYELRQIVPYALLVPAAEEAKQDTDAKAAEEAKQDIDAKASTSSPSSSDSTAASMMVDDFAPLPLPEQTVIQPLDDPQSWTIESVVLRWLRIVRKYVYNNTDAEEWKEDDPSASHLPHLISAVLEGATKCANTAIFTRLMAHERNLELAYLLKPLTIEKFLTGKHLLSLWSNAYAEMLPWMHKQWRAASASNRVGAALASCLQFFSLDVIGIVVEYVVTTAPSDEMEDEKDEKDEKQTSAVLTPSDALEFLQDLFFYTKPYTAKAATYTFSVYENLFVDIACHQLLSPRNPDLQPPVILLPEMQTILDQFLVWYETGVLEHLTGYFLLEKMAELAMKQTFQQAGFPGFMNAALVVSTVLRTLLVVSPTSDREILLHILPRAVWECAQETKSVVRGTQSQDNGGGSGSTSSTNAEAVDEAEWVWERLVLENEWKSNYVGHDDKEREDIALHILLPPGVRREDAPEDIKKRDHHTYSKLLRMLTETCVYYSEVDLLGLIQNITQHSTTDSAIVQQFMQLMSDKFDQYQDAITWRTHMLAQVPHKASLDQTRWSFKVPLLRLLHVITAADNGILNSIDGKRYRVAIPDPDMVNAEQSTKDLTRMLQTGLYIAPPPSSASPSLSSAASGFAFAAASLPPRQRDRVPEPGLEPHTEDEEAQHLNVTMSRSLYMLSGSGKDEKKAPAPKKQQQQQPSSAAAAAAPGAVSFVSHTPLPLGEHYVSSGSQSQANVSDPLVPPAFYAQLTPMDTDQ